MPGSKVMSDNPYDVVIVGGGMVGATLANALAMAFENKLSVLVVERQAPGENLPSSTFDARSIVLSRSTVRFLYQYGLWPDIKPHVTPIRYIQAQSKGQFGELLLSAQEAGVPALGYVVSGAHLGHALWRRMSGLEAVTWRGRSQVKRLEPKRDGWRLELEQPSASGQDESGNGHNVNVQSHRVSARLLVVSDGARSRTLPLMGIATDYHDYKLKAIVGMFDKCVTAHPPNTALELFLPGSESIALLPREDDQAGVVYAMQSDRADVALQMVQESRGDFFVKAFGASQVQSLGRCLDLQSYPLMSSMAKELVRSNMVVLGNAAQTMHPIAGQGFNLAVRDLASLVQQMSLQQYSGHKAPSLLSDRALQRYADDRSSDRRKIRQFCQGLLSLFASEQRAAVWLRQLGMCAFDLYPEAKAWLSHRVLAPRAGLGVREFS